MKRDIKTKINRVAKNAWIKFLESFALVVLFCRKREKRFKKICNKYNIDPATARKVIKIFIKIFAIIIVLIFSIDNLEWLSIFFGVIS